MYIFERKKLENTIKTKSVVREYVEAILIAAILALFIRTFIIQAFKIPSGSMLPTLLIGDHLLVNKFKYGVKVPFTGTTILPFGKPVRGDIIVFRYPRDRSIDYIKRLIGTPGDTVELRKQVLLVNGEKVDDPYAWIEPNSLRSPKATFGPVTVPEGSYFVMGDNRNNSSDSRFWGFVDQKDILGNAFILYWSWDLKKPLMSIGRFTSIRWSRIGDIIH